MIDYVFDPEQFAADMLELRGELGEIMGPEGVAAFDTLMKMWCSLPSLDELRPPPPTEAEQKRWRRQLRKASKQTYRWMEAQR